jgi:hypothetical protein
VVITKDLTGEAITKMVEISSNTKRKSNILKMKKRLKNNLQLFPKLKVS